MVSKIYESRSAEKVIFRELFTNASTVVANGGVLTGDPVFQPGGGISLDGAADYVTYDIPGTLLARDQISFVVKFIPNFDADADVSSVIFDTTASMRFRVQKKPNANSDTLRIFAGEATIDSIPYATYSPYWVVDEENTIVLASESANTSVWLNGVLILDGDTTAWTVKYPTELIIGADNTSLNFFGGEVKSLSIHNRLLTQEDATAIQNNSLFTYRNKADVWLDFSSMADNVISDKSGNGKSATVDGCSFLAPGIFFDGVNDKLDQSLADPTGTFTVAYKKRNETTTFESDLTTWNLIKSAGSFSGTLDYLAVFPFTLSPVQQEDLIWMRGGAR